MFSNYLKTFLRNLNREKLFSTINILSVAIGLSAAMLILVFILNETGYDSYHEKKERLYRLSNEIELLSTGQRINVATSSILWAPVMKQEFSGIESYTRLYQSVLSQESYKQGPIQLMKGDQIIEEENYLFAEANLFQNFSWNLKSGDEITALVDPFSVVLTESSAIEYFGHADNVIGKRVGVVYNIEDEEGNSKIEIKEFKVTGIMDEVPEKSHVHPRIVFSISTLNSTLGGNILEGSHPEDWFWRGRIAHTYILLKEGVQPETLNNQFVSFIKKYVDEATTTRGYKYNLNLERIDEIHLHADVYNNFEQPTSRSTLNSLGISALLILLIAIINFVNLSTAKSTTRSKEVGIRKVLGATKGKLVLQYLGESIMYTLIAFAGASLLVYLVQPTFFFYLGKSYSLTGINLFFYILMVAGLALFVGVVSGSFSAFILSGLSVTKTLKGEFKSGLKGNILRKGLVVAQFSITVIFIILTITVYQQISYMQDKELGFNKNQLLVINPSSNEKLLSNLKSVKNELESYSSIKDVSISSSVPGAPVGGDIWVREDQSGEEAVQISEIVVDYNYLSTFEIELIAGRNFNKEFGQDRYDVYNPEMTVETSIIINEASVKQFGFEDPQDAIGKVVVRDPASKDFYGRIIGVVKDFNYDKLQYKISPLVMFISDWYASNIRCVTIKYNGGDTRPILNFAKSVYSKYNIDEELSYFFVDENFNSLYEEQERSGEIYAYVSGLTVLIACMGLFGLSVFSTQRRTKEIAIRKIVGSSVFDLIKLLSAEFVLLLFIANLLALPVAYYFIQDWLEEFAYRIDIGVDIFLLVAISTIFISLLTVGYQVIKVASANPIDSIKYE